MAERHALAVLRLNSLPRRHRGRFNCRRTTARLATFMLLWLLCPRVSAQVNRDTAPQAVPPSVSAGLVDERLVTNELAKDRHLLASGIRVNVSNGIVSLTGTVPNSPSKERAARVAGLVRGVRAVINRIRVAPVRRADAIVARDVREALHRTAALARMPIRVRVQKGVVELHGSISAWNEQQMAERVVTAVPGVRFCENQLTWSGAIQRTPAIIAADIESRFEWDPLVGHDRISVSVTGGRVVLTGTTRSAAVHRRAVLLASVKDVTEIDAKALAIVPTSPPDVNLRTEFPTDQEISQAIQDLASYWPGVDATKMTTSVVGGVVTLRGAVQTIADDHAIESMVRSAVGVVDLRNELRGPWWSAPARPHAPLTRRRTPQGR
jgi:osmotically-inducible protein OsmY